MMRDVEQKEVSLLPLVCWYVIIAAVVLLFAVVLVQPVSAIPLCCKNFTISEGQTWESYEDATQWNGFGTNTTNDTTYFREGTQGIRVTALNGVQTDTVKTINQNFSNSDVFVVWVYVDNAINVSSIRFHIANDAAMTNLYGMTNPITSAHLKDGWNRFSFSKSSAVVGSGSPSWNQNMTRLRLRVIPNAGKNVNITYDDFRVNYSARPKLIISFDDDNTSIYNLAFPLIKSLNLRAQSFIVTGRINGYDNTSLDNYTAMTTTQLQEMQNYGWDIGSHSVTHSDLISINNTQRLYEINGSHLWLVNNGFERTSCCLAYPYGNYNNTVLDYVRPVFTIARSTLESEYQPDYETSDGDNISLIMKKLNVDTNDSSATILNRINLTIVRNGTSIMLFHRIAPGTSKNFSLGGIEYDQTNFTTIINYISQRSLDGSIDVITMHDLLIDTNLYYSKNLSYPVYNSIYPNGTISYNYNSLSYLANASITPSSSSINVTILTWNTAGDYHKTIIASSSVHDNPTTFTIGDFPANTLIQVQVDGVNSSRFTSDVNGYISFTYNGWSDHQFDFFLGSVGRCEGVTSNINTAFTLFGVVLIFVALGGFILSLRALNPVLLMSSIVLVMVGGVLIYAGMFAVASLGVVVC